MGQIYQKDFSAGWCPSDSSVNGRKNGFLDFSNVTLDENGAVTLAKGTSKVNSSGFSNDVNSIYSRVINAVKHRYVGILNGNVVRDTGAGTFTTTVVTDASTEKAAFGTAFGMVFVSKGTQRKKDNGSTIVNLGLTAPTVQPIIAYPVQPIIDVSGSSGGTYAALWQSVETSVYDESNNWIAFDTSTTTFRGIAQAVYAAPLDMTALSLSSIGTDEDLFFFDINISDSSLIKRVRIEFYLTNPGTGGAGDPLADNYFYFEDWPRRTLSRSEFRDPPSRIPGLNDSPFTPGVYQQTRLSCRRKDFIKLGSNAALNWKSIAAMRIIVEGTAVLSIAASSFNFLGGTKGPLKGNPQYTQVNVNNTGSYLAQSNYGPISNEILSLDGSFLTITPETPAEAQANETWIYRRGGTLDKWYRIKVVTTPYSAFSDQLSDEDAILLNETLDERIISVQSIPDSIRGIEGPFFGRILYMTYKEIYVSLLGNPDSCNSAATLSTAGSLSEINLFITKVSNSAIYLGTTNDLYEISGTFSDLPDGLVDVSVRPLGLAKPPISDAFVNHDGALVYMAEDGWRMLRGNSSDLLIENIDLLYRGITRYGTVGVNVVAQNNIQYSVCLSKGRLFTSQFLTDSTSTVFVYDLIRKYWRKYNLAVNQLFAEEDGTVLGGYYGAGNRFLKILDTGTTIDGGAGLPISLKTPFYHDNLPRNRKDSFSLKFKIDTGNVACTLTLYKDESSSAIALGTITSNGLTEKSIDNFFNLVGLAKSYQLEFTGTLNAFKLEDWTLDYEARPAQSTYLRIPPTNYGVAGRKRISEIPFRIDTLGSAAIRFTPVLDGVSGTPSTIPASNEISTYSHQYTTDLAAYEVGGFLDTVNQNAYFEFYNLIQPREIELLPDPIKFKHLPHTNLGTHSRKRITAIALVINTNGANVTYTPVVDGVALASSILNTIFKQTVVHYFTSEVIGVDIGGSLSGASPFEFYEIDEKESISEKLPTPTRFLVIPQDDYGTSARKRFSSYKFVINTKGAAVTFTPKIDGVTQAAQSFTTTEKRTVEYFFTSDTIGIDIGGTLNGATEFEFYGPLRPKVIEELPERLTFFVIPENNFGIAAKKRVRTLPMIINTNGVDVIFTPIVDGVSLATSAFNTSSKRTVLHYFMTDVFGIDFKGTLNGASPFEFYGMLKPEEVQILPVAKKFDQLGPVEFNKLGKLISFRVKILPTGTELPYIVYMEDTSIASGTIVVIPDKEDVYEVKLPKSINGTVCRIELGPTFHEFHRFDVELSVNLSGSVTDRKLIRVK